jgi:hypothetical protein
VWPAIEFMSLDAHVRCTCVKEGRAKPYPVPAQLTLDETGAPSLKGEFSEDEYEALDRWVQESCEHRGFLVAESLGNITLAKHLREFLRGLQGDPGPRFPILLEKVVYDGTHTGDWIPGKEAPNLLKEVDLVLHSSDILSAAEKEFFLAMKRLCEASISTGNPIVF